MKDLRQEARLVDHGISMSNPLGEDVTATIQASVNSAMASMQQLMTLVATMEPNPSNRVPHRPPQQKQQQPVNQHDSRREKRECALGVVSHVFQNLMVELETKNVTIAAKRVTVNVYVRITY